jgi:uncharacterized protein YndB with AHSA1/START domain
VRQFSITFDVAAAPDRVWTVMSDTDRWPEWTPSVTKITKLDDGPYVVGSRAIIRQPGFPPAFWRVTAIEPGRSFTWVSPGPGFKMFAHHWVEATPTGSKVTLSLDLQGLLGGLFGRLTKGITERYLKMEATGLKARSENPEFRHSA